MQNHFLAITTSVKKNLIQHIEVVIYITIIMLINSGCDPGDNKLTLINNSEDTIYYLTSGNDSINYYPIFLLENGNIDWHHSNYIPPGSEKHLGTLGKWEVKVEKSENKILRVFIFSSALIKGINRDSLLHKQSYSKIFRLNLDDLEKMDWRLTYP